MNSNITGTLNNGIARYDTGGITEAKAREIAQSVVDAFEETDPTVPDWAKAESKPTYTAAEVGAVPESAKSNIDKNTAARHTHENKSALDVITTDDILKWNSGTAGTVEIVGATALEAGNSPTIAETADSTERARKYLLGIPKGKKGADGAQGTDGKSAYQFAQDGGYSGTETDFIQKLNKEKFANPYPLIFTGATSATYDGSSSVTVDLPSGGSVSGYKIVTVTLDADASRVDISQNATGEALSAHELYWITLTKSATTANEKYSVLINGGWSGSDPYISPNHTTSKSTDTWFNSAYGHMIVQDGVVLSTNMTQGTSKANSLGAYSKYTEITSVNFVNATFAAGCTFILIYR